VNALVLSFVVALVLHMRSACCSIAWFPGIVPIGFLLAKVRPLTIFIIFFYNIRTSLGLINNIIIIIKRAILNIDI
jgi:hypothetical protein